MDASKTSIPRNLAEFKPTEDQMKFVPTLNIRNTVATFSICHRQTDPAELSDHIGGISFNPRQFAACTIRLSRATVLIFNSGKGVCAGAHSTDGARVTCAEAVRILCEAGKIVSFGHFAVRNIVHSSECGFNVDIDAIFKSYMFHVEYKSDKFPGLVLRIPHPKIVFIIFVSGKVIVTGARAPEDAQRAWSWCFLEVCSKFRMRHEKFASAAQYHMQLVNSNKMASALLAAGAVRYTKVDREWLGKPDAADDVFGANSSVNGHQTKNPWLDNGSLGFHALPPRLALQSIGCKHERPEDDSKLAPLFELMGGDHKPTPSNNNAPPTPIPSSATSDDQDLADQHERGTKYVPLDKLLATEYAQARKRMAAFQPERNAPKRQHKSLAGLINKYLRRLS